jgi:putative Holliday junction resolvase
MAIDPGSKRVGVAISDPLGVAVRPLPPLPGESGPDALAAAIGSLLAANPADKLVVGLPRNMNGSEGPGAASARILAEKLRFRFPALQVVLWDERLTTVAAEKTLLAADLSRKRRRRLIDGQAAAILLQDYLHATRAQDEDRGGQPPQERVKQMPGEDREDIVVLTDDEGNEVEFLFLDAFEVGEKRYAVLVPLEGTDDEDQESTDEDYIEGSEAMIFRLEKDEKGDEVFVEIEDDEEWAEVTAAWEDLQDEEFDEEDEDEEDEDRDEEEEPEDDLDEDEDDEEEPGNPPRRLSC